MDADTVRFHIDPFWISKFLELTHRNIEERLMFLEAVNRGQSMEHKDILSLLNEIGYQPVYCLLSLNL